MNINYKNILGLLFIYFLIMKVRIIRRAQTQQNDHLSYPLPLYVYIYNFDKKHYLQFR